MGPPNPFLTKANMTSHLSTQVFISEIKLPEGDVYYKSTLGHTIKREYGATPNNNAIKGRWVLRDASNKWLDVDRYRNDLFDKHNLIVRREDTPNQEPS